MRPSEQARQTALRAIAEARAAGSDRLATVAVLAAAAGVSLVTMWRAVRRLCDEGVLRAAPRSGIRLADQARRPPADAAAPPRSEPASAEQVLATDLVRGTWRPGTRLPPCKTLEHRYGVGFARLKRALARLADDGQLAKAGKGYTVVSHASTRQGGTLLLLCCRSSLPELSSITERIGALCAVLEQECCARSARLLVVNAERSGREVQRAVRLACQRSVALGYVVVPAGLSHDALQRALRYLARDTRPFCVLDPLGDQPLVARYAPPARGCLVTIDTHFRAGARVGRFLLERGHRRVAYISPYIRFDWCRDRFDGLRYSFARAGLNRGVAPITDATLENYGEIHSWISAQAWYRSVRRHAQSIETIADRRFGVDDHLLLDRHVLPGLVNRFIDHRVRPLFQTALRDRGVSAWVVTNDMVALLALRFLGQRRDGHVAVVGFDGSPEASLHGLTSYSFNVAAVVHEGLNHVLGPGRGRRGRVVVVPGLLVERDSTVADPAT